MWQIVARHAATVVNYAMDRSAKKKPEKLLGLKERKTDYAQTDLGIQTRFENLNRGIRLPAAILSWNVTNCRHWIKKVF